jgi:O-antigen ligase
VISVGEPQAIAGRRPSLTPTTGRVVGGMTCAVLTGALVAYLVSSGRWYLALGFLLIPPAFVLLHRYPLAALTIWLLAAPLVVETDSTQVRKIFWIIHRALPVVTVAVIMFSSMLGIRARRLPTLGWPELMLAGYVVASLLSIAYTSNDSVAATYLLYDRVFVPMCLYAIVRLLEPDERDFMGLLPAVVFILVSQSVLGVLAWMAPDVLPEVWLGKLGERTTGSLRDPNTFGTTVLFCGMFVLYAGLSARNGWVRRVWAPLLFALALLMVFLTFSRAVWLAGFIAIIGTLYIYRRVINRIVAIPIAAVIVMLASGLLAEPIELARYRLGSEQSQESALSRLPVVYASVRMFEAKPLFGWGYGGFDRFDRQFQRPVGNVVYPQKDHASHNLFLTILAEQGIIGFALFVGPMLYWLFRTRSSLANIRADSFLSRRLLAMLWLVFAAFVLVNNFMVMHVPFGLGLWWLTLGLIGSIVHRSRTTSEETRHVSLVHP